MDATGKAQLKDQLLSRLFGQQDVFDKIMPQLATQALAQQTDEHLDANGDRISKYSNLVSERTKQMKSNGFSEDDISKDAAIIGWNRLITHFSTPKAA